MANYSAGLRLNPHDASAHSNLGNALKHQGRYPEAASPYLEVLRLQPTNAEAHCSLGSAFASQGKGADALPHFSEAVRLQPASADYPFNSPAHFLSRERPREAAAQYREALRLEPGFVPAMNDLAFILASSADDSMRNGPQAVALAERACELTGRKQAYLVGTLAAAHAEAGQFPQAVESAQQALALAQATGQKELAETNQKLLELYQSGKPYRQ